MVKTPNGRKPGRRHARIVKKLRHRRRMLAAQTARQLALLPASTPDTVSTATPTTSSSFSSFVGGYGIGKAPSLECLDCLSVSTAADGNDLGMEVLERAPELEETQTEEEDGEVEDAPRHLYFDDSEVNYLSTYDESEQPADAAVAPVKKISNRGASESEAVVVGNGAKNVDRPSVSESGMHDAIPMPPPPSLNEEAVVIQPQHQDLCGEERMQHPDEETDRYLAHFFAPSIADMTTTTTETVAGEEVDTRSDEFLRLRNLFSSVISDNTSSTLPETLPGLRHFPSQVYSLNNTSLREYIAAGHHDGEEESGEKFKHGLPSAVSEQSLGLNTLFNNSRTLENGISCETSMGLRSLFGEVEEEGQQAAPHSTASTLGLRTLFNQHGEDEEAQKSTVGNLLRSTASTLGLRTLFNNHDQSSKEEEEDPKSSGAGNLRSLSHMPSLTSTSSILGNLFGSEHSIHGNRSSGIGGEEESLSAKERMKVLIAQDLAHYLDGCGTAGGGQRNSSTLSTFVQQIDNLFANYLVAVKQIERLEKEVAQAKKDQNE